MRVGEVVVRPGRNLIVSIKGQCRVEPKGMEVLCALAEAEGAVCTRSSLLDSIWGANAGSDESLSRAIAVVRAAFRDVGAANPIETIPLRGYRIKPTLRRWRENGRAIGSCDPEANRLYLQARSQVADIFAEGGPGQAVAQLESVLAIDPAFAEGWSTLAQAYSHLAAYTPLGDRMATITKASSAARRALALQPGLAIPHTVLGHSRIGKCDFVGAVELAETGYGLDPENSEVAMRLGYFLAMIGHIERAIPYLEKAVFLAPLQGRNLMLLALATLAAEDLDSAERYAAQAIGVKYSAATEVYAAVAHARGDDNLAHRRFACAKAPFLRLFAERPATAKLWDVAWQGVYSQVASQRDDALAACAKLASAMKHPEGMLLQLMLRMGAADQFFETFGDRALPGNDAVLLSLWCQTEPSRFIRGSRAFPEFARAIGLEKAWKKLGLPDCASCTTTRPRTSRV